jgi:DNA-binding MarR family transcriptional regulator
VSTLENSERSLEVLQAIVAMLRALDRWQSSMLPIGVSGPIVEIVVWLLETDGSTRSLKDLYRSSRYSEPTIRASLKRLVDHKLVCIETNGSDRRRRVARPTRKFSAMLEELHLRLTRAPCLA